MLPPRSLNNDPGFHFLIYFLVRVRTSGPDSGGRPIGVHYSGTGGDGTYKHDRQPHAAPWRPAVAVRRGLTSRCDTRDVPAEGSFLRQDSRMSGPHPTSEYGRFDGSAIGRGYQGSSGSQSPKRFPIFCATGHVKTSSLLEKPQSTL